MCNSRGLFSYEKTCEPLFKMLIFNPSTALGFKFQLLTKKDILNAFSTVRYTETGKHMKNWKVHAVHRGRQWQFRNMAHKVRTLLHIPETSQLKRFAAA
jgi:hypothetical protein